MLARVTVDEVGQRMDVTVIDGVAYCDEPVLADVVNRAAANRQIFECTATGPFRDSLEGSPVAVVEYVAGVLGVHGFNVVATDPPRGSYETPEGAVQSPVSLP
ncbi:MAG: hypothetical protein M3Q30_09250 [Actinomycetota bacterium]|nr:hypothetical protein [Actinomycetota bacterium]